MFDYSKGGALLYLFKCAAYVHDELWIPFKLLKYFIMGNMFQVFNASDKMVSWSQIQANFKSI